MSSALHKDRLTMDRLVFSSGHVVVGTVIETDPAAGIESPLTRTLISVEEDFGTHADSTLEFWLPEGQLGNRFSRIGGAPKLHEGKRYLMFLRRGEWSLTPYTDWGDGVFLLEDDVVLTLDGRCVTDVRGHLQAAATVAQPEPIPGPVIDGRRQYLFPSPDESDLEWIDADMRDCLSEGEVLHAVSQAVEWYHSGEFDFSPYSFRDGANIPIEQPTGFEQEYDPAPQCFMLDEQNVCEGSPSDGNP